MAGEQVPWVTTRSLTPDYPQSPARPVLLASPSLFLLLSFCFRFKTYGSRQTLLYCTRLTSANHRLLVTPVHVARPTQPEVVVDGMCLCTRYRVPGGPAKVKAPRVLSLRTAQPSPAQPNLMIPSWYYHGAMVHTVMVLGNWSTCVPPCARVYSSGSPASGHRGCASALARG